MWYKAGVTDIQGRKGGGVAGGKGRQACGEGAGGGGRWQKVG